MAGDGNSTKHALWVGIGKQLLTFLAGVVVAAFILGRNSQKINEVVDWKKEATTRWKTEVAPRIERMDRQGSISFENFKQHYDKEQTEQYARLKHLEDEVNHMDKIELRLDNLERAVRAKIKDDPADPKPKKE